MDLSADASASTLKALAEADMLHGRRLADALDSSASGIRVDVLVALRAQPARREDLDIVRRFRQDASMEVRSACAGTLWIYGPAVQPLLIESLKDESDNGRHDIGASSARSLGLVGDAVSLGPLEDVAIEGVKGVWLATRKAAAKEALLACEARLGAFKVAKRREGFWSDPAGHRRGTENAAECWRLASVNSLHGQLLKDRLSSASTPSQIKQLLEAFFEQETDPDDFDAVAALVHDDRAARLDVAGRLWRFGARVEPLLMELLGQAFSISGPAARSLEKIGTSACLDALTRQGNEASHPLAITGLAKQAIAVVEARLR